MHQSTVWAFQALPELGNKTGFVACDSATASELIACGKAQDPRVGAKHLKHIGSGYTAPAVTYKTKVMTPEPAAPAPAPAPVPAPEPLPAKKVEEAIKELGNVTDRPD